MKFVVNFKPQTYHVRDTHNSVKHIDNVYRWVNSNFRGSRYTSSSNFGTALASSDGKTIYAFNAQKIRARKVRVTKGKNKGKYKVTEPARIIVRVYNIPVEFFNLTNTRIDQGNRNFKIVSWTK